MDTDEGHGSTEWSGELVLALEALQEAVDQAKQELNALYRRLLPIVESQVPPDQAVEIAERLTATNPTYWQDPTW